MKKLAVKKNVECMACLECVRACSNAFYKEFDPDKSCIQIIDRKGVEKPMVCVQCGKCAAACEAGAITQNAKGVYVINKKLCVGCGKCVGVCPIRLEPIFMYKYLMKGNWEAFRDQFHGMDCIECGACTYTGPARLPLTHAFRLGKQQVNNARMAAQAKAAAEKKEG